ncbi:MAG: hypothetical protein ACPGAP_02325 [Akkermansiaceae bacterium]
MKEHVPKETVYLTRRELADRWKCSVMTLKRRERDGFLNPLRTGRIVRYPLEQIQRLETSQ